MKKYITDEFRCSWHSGGYTYEEAMRKKEAVDEAHGVGKTMWEPSRIVPDERGGFKIVISTIRLN